MSGLARVDDQDGADGSGGGRSRSISQAGPGPRTGVSRARTGGGTCRATLLAAPGLHVRRPGRRLVVPPGGKCSEGKRRGRGAAVTFGVLALLFLVVLAAAFVQGASGMAVALLFAPVAG